MSNNVRVLANDKVITSYNQAKEQTVSTKKLPHYKMVIQRLRKENQRLQAENSQLKKEIIEVGREIIRKEKKGTTMWANLD